MESTLKIATSSRGVHGVPVIKIVQPVYLSNPIPGYDFEDVKDELISSLLHTPCMQYPNQLFRVDSRFQYPADGESKVVITTISAIEEGQMFHAFKHAIFDRLISYENLCDCIEFEKRPSGPGAHGPVPFDYDKYLKIKEFFDWVWDQPYNGDPVNTPIETRRDTQPKPVIPMETIRDYFEMTLEQGERINAFENTPKVRLDMKVQSIAEAFQKAFNIFESKQGAEYWHRVIDRVDGKEKQPLIKPFASLTIDELNKL